MTSTAEVLVALAEVGRGPILDAGFNRRSCIASTRIGLDVLDYFGIKAEPLPLFVLLLNGEALDLWESGMSQAEIAIEMQKQGRDEPGGPWGIGIGAEIENSVDWAGHLVIAVPQERALLDLSIDQASRPHKGLPIKDKGLLIPVDDDDWWEGRATRAFMTGTLANDTDQLRLAMIFDRDCADPKGYRNSPNWRRTNAANTFGPTAFREVTGKIIRLVKEELA